MVKNCPKLATDQKNTINKHLATSTPENVHQDLVNRNSCIIYIKASSSTSSPFEMSLKCLEIKSVVHAIAAHSLDIYSNHCLPDFALCLIHTDFIQLIINKMKTQSATTHMGASRYTRISQKHNCNKHHQKSDEEIDSCISGLTIWVNRDRKKSGNQVDGNSGRAKSRFLKSFKRIFWVDRT